MWATHRGLSKPCANRASCPSPSGSGGSRWSHRFLSEQIGEQDDSFAVRTAASESHRASVQMAVRAAPLAKEALATTRTFVDGVRHEQSLALELLAEDDQIDGGQRLVTQPIGQLFTAWLTPTAPQQHGHDRHQHIDDSDADCSQDCTRRGWNAGQLDNGRRVLDNG